MDIYVISSYKSLSAWWGLGPYQGLSLDPSKPTQKNLPFSKDINYMWKIPSPLPNSWLEANSPGQGLKEPLMPAKNPTCHQLNQDFYDLDHGVGIFFFFKVIQVIQPPYCWVSDSSFWPKYMYLGQLRSNLKTQNKEV